MGDVWILHISCWTFAERKPPLCADSGSFSAPLPSAHTVFTSLSRSPGIGLRVGKSAAEAAGIFGRDQILFAVHVVATVVSLSLYTSPPLIHPPAWRWLPIVAGLCFCWSPPGHRWRATPHHASLRCSSCVAQALSPEGLSGVALRVFNVIL